MESRLSLVLGDLMRIVGTRQKRSNRDPLGAFLEPLKTVSQIGGGSTTVTVVLSLQAGPERPLGYPTSTTKMPRPTRPLNTENHRRGRPHVLSRSS